MKVNNLCTLLLTALLLLVVGCGDSDSGGGSSGASGSSSGGSSGGAANRVDLRHYQTPGEPTAGESAPSLRNQGGRTTCITFAATAALEAAYKRAGYGDLDLSEEFINYTGKVLWLHPNWNDFLGWDVNRRENQAAFTGGGGSVGWLRNLAGGYYSVAEHYMPYVDINDYGYGFPGVGEDGPAWDDPFWRDQRNANDFNLNPANFARDDSPDARFAEHYYSIADMTVLCADDSRVAPRRCNTLDPSAYEEVLRDGREVSIDFVVRGDRSGAIWQRDDDQPRLGGHAMLLVGYDRTDPDNPYFIAKNSWGPTSGGVGGDCGEDGYTCISYDYLSYIYAAGYIVSVNPPRSWAELAFMGRWDLSFNGIQGTLDIYHIPGIMEGVFEIESDRFTHYTDRRLGTFYSDTGDAYRVNGSINERRLDFYIDFDQPRLRWDLLTGHHFTFHMFDLDRDTMAGTLEDPTGNRSVGYARRTFDGTGFLAPREAAGVITPETYLGDWDVVYDGHVNELHISEVSPWVRISLGQEYAQLLAETRLPGSATAHSFIAYVPLYEPERIEFDALLSSGVDHRVYARAMTWEKGVLAGRNSHGGAIATRPVIPPSIEILSPAEGASYPRGRSGVSFVARTQGVADVRWYSWMAGGNFATGHHVTRFDLPVGDHNVTAYALDEDGNEIWFNDDWLTDTVNITIYDEPPTVELIEPQAGNSYCTGEAFTLRADGRDFNNWPTFTLPNSAFTWYSSPAGVALTGKEGTASYGSAGSLQIVVRATAPGGLFAEEDVNINIVECTNEAPVVTITTPASNSSSSDPAYAYNGYDTALGLWYTDVLFQGTATDFEDGVLTGSSLVWTTDQTSVQAAHLGTGNSINARLYSSQCGGTWHTVRLAATDSDGNVRYAYRSVFIWTLC